LLSSAFLNPTSNSEGWTVTGAKSQSSSCSGVALFGGFNVFGTGAAITKVIGNIPIHNALRLRLQFWKIDSWDNEFARIYVDGVLIWN
jgi:hypothetical protein